MNQQTNQTEGCVKSLRRRVEELTRKLSTIFQGGVARHVRERVAEFDGLQEEIGTILSLYHPLVMLEKASEQAKEARRRVVDSPAFRTPNPLTAS